MPWGRTQPQRKEDCFGCSFQTNPMPRSVENQGGWRHGPSGETHGPLAHLHCCSLAGVPKERADGLQIFLKVRNCLLQLNWKREKKLKKKIPTEENSGENEGQKMYIFYIKLEIGFIFLKINIFSEMFHSNCFLWENFL